QTIHVSDHVVAQGPRGSFRARPRRPRGPAAASLASFLSLEQYCGGGGMGVKVQIPGGPQLLGKTPEEILEGLMELGFMDPPSSSPASYVEHLAGQLSSRFGVEVDRDGDLADRAEAVIYALASVGQLDVLED